MPIKHRIIPDMTPQQIERFWKRVRISAPDECWLWIGSTCAGYGCFGLNYHSFYANRIAYYLHYQKDPGDLNALHSCDNPPCCNPNHLWLGTDADNNADMIRKGRGAYGNGSGPRRYPERLRRGATHWKVKLTEPDIPIIRALYNEGYKSKDIAARYKVNTCTIVNIVKRRRWGYVP